MQLGWKLYQIIKYSLSITSWKVLCNLKEQLEIYPETVIPTMHWPIKQTVHIIDLIIQIIAVSAIHFHGCSIFIHKPTCPVHLVNFLHDMDFLGPWMYGYATVSYNQILTTWDLTGPNCHSNSCIKGKKMSQSQMNWLLSEAIMNGQYCRSLIVTHIRKFKRDNKWGQYSEVQKFACVYLKIKPNQFSKGALHRKMMHYGI